MKAKVYQLILGILVMLGSISQVLGQQRLDPNLVYERLIAVVPMTGSGTANDPRRPMYVPVRAPGETLVAEAVEPDGSAERRLRQGILGFSYVLSDDEQFALVEFVAGSRSAFKEIQADTSVKAFVKGRSKRVDIEREFRRYKQNFNLDRLGVRLP